jgi:hypothetical protein
VGEYTLLQDELGWCEEIDRNPALNPLLNEQLERGDEYASSEDDDKDVAPICPEPEPSAASAPPSMVNAELARVAASCRDVVTESFWP